MVTAGRARHSDRNPEAGAAMSVLADTRVDRFRCLKRVSRLPEVQAEWAAFVSAALDEPLERCRTADMEETLRLLDMVDARIDTEARDAKLEHAGVTEDEARREDGRRRA